MIQDLAVFAAPPGELNHVGYCEPLEANVWRPEYDLKELLSLFEATFYSDTACSTCSISVKGTCAYFHSKLSIESDTN